MLSHWQRANTVAGATRIAASQAFADPAPVKSGLIFMLDFDAGLGYSGVVERVLPGGRLATIVGTTNNDGSRSGFDVFRLERRKLNDPSLKGFVD